MSSFSTNLISVSQADAHGAFYAGGSGRMRIHDAAVVILLQGVLRNGLYHADCAADRPSSFTPSSSSAIVPGVSYAAAAALDAMPYYRRFGHIGMSSLARMSKNGFISNLPSAVSFIAALK